MFLPAEPVSNVTISANVLETVEFNSTVVLTCSAKGSFLKFSWTSGTAPIMADNTRVSIKEVRLSDWFYLTRFKFGQDCNEEDYSLLLSSSIFPFIFCFHCRRSHTVCSLSAVFRVQTWLSPSSAQLPTSWRWRGAPPSLSLSSVTLSSPRPHIK